MRLGGIEALAAEFDGADFHDDAALAESGVAVARRKDAADARTAPDPAAGERRLASTARREPAPKSGGGDAAPNNISRAVLAGHVTAQAGVQFTSDVPWSHRHLG